MIHFERRNGPRSRILHEKINAERVSLLENSHFHQDRPHSAHSLLEKRPMTHFQERNGGVRELESDLGWELGYEVRGPDGRAAGNPYHSPWPGKFSIHHLLIPTLIT